LSVWDSSAGAFKTVTIPRERAWIKSIHLEGNRVAVASGNTVGIRDVRDGRFVGTLLGGSGVDTVWIAVTEDRWCVASSRYEDRNKLHFWDLEMIWKDGFTEKCQ
jgi:hypothetical protein